MQAGFGKVPEIHHLRVERDDFHDSSLVSFVFEPDLNTVEAVLVTESLEGRLEPWKVSLQGVLRVEWETSGTEYPRPGVPPEVYSVYYEDDIEECRRWQAKLRRMGQTVTAATVYVVTFASSELRGWGEREALEGIRVVCKGFLVSRAPDRFVAIGVRRPRIPAAEDGMP